MDNLQFLLANLIAESLIKTMPTGVQFCFFRHPSCGGHAPFYSNTNVEFYNHQDNWQILTIYKSYCYHQLSIILCNMIMKKKSVSILNKHKFSPTYFMHMFVWMYTLHIECVYKYFEALWNNLWWWCYYKFKILCLKKLFTMYIFKFSMC